MMDGSLVGWIVVVVVSLSSNNNNKVLVLCLFLEINLFARLNCEAGIRREGMLFVGIVVVVVVIVVVTVVVICKARSH